MKNYSLTASIISAFLLVNALADGSFEDQDVCTVKSNFHKNLAGIVTDDVGIQVINELRQVGKDICMDPKAHDGIVSSLDAIMDVVTDPNVSEIVGASLFWIRSLIKNKNFRDIWYENVKGLNMLFDNEPIVSPLIDTMFDNLTDLLNNPLFDSTLERLINKMAFINNLRKNALYKTGARVSRSIGGRRNARSDLRN